MPLWPVALKITPKAVENAWSNGRTVSLRVWGPLWSLSFTWATYAMRRKKINALENIQTQCVFLKFSQRRSFQRAMIFLKENWRDGMHVCVHA